jgi:hypothetical protein
MWYFGAWKIIPGGKPGKEGAPIWEKSLVGIAAEKEEKRIGRIWLVRVPDGSPTSLKGAISHPNYVIFYGK